MMASTHLGWSVLVSCSVLLAAVCGADAQLSEDFYQNTCPKFKSIVREIVDDLPRNDNVAGGLTRLAFHDCWVRGCDGSVLLQSTSTNAAERDSFANFKLRGFAEIDQIKEKLETVCPGVVSCADIIALAARDAVVSVGGPSWNVVFGRRDGRVSSAIEANFNLPFPNLSFGGLVSNFATKGFSAREMIVLSGAHTLGGAHCNGVQPHLYNFTGGDNLTDVDPSLEKFFVKELREKCPKGDRETLLRQMDSTGGIFDVDYFIRVLLNKGLFTSDAALISTPSGKSIVQELQTHQFTWFAEFGAAMLKMSKLGVLTGTQGEIRKHCQLVN